MGATRSDDTGSALPSTGGQVGNGTAHPVGVEALCERYGLQSNPFADAPERFFGGGQRQHDLETLRHLCGFGDMFLIVAGQSGVGRSRLLAELCRYEKSHLDFRQLKHGDCASSFQLAQTLWGFLRLPSPPSADPVQAIGAFFKATHWRTPSVKRWVLLLDDADRIPREVLDALALGFGQSDRGRAPVPVVVGTAALAEDLGRRLDGPQWLHQLTLNPLNEEESGQYIERCFEWAGADRAEILDPRRRQQLYLRSGGYFDRLKQAAPEVILGAPTAGLKEPATPASRRRSPRRNALWLALALILLSVSYILVSWQYRQPPIPAVPAGNGVVDEVERLRQAMAAAETRIRPEPAPAEMPVEPEPTTEDGMSGEGRAAVQPGNLPLLPESIRLSVAEVLAMELVEPAPTQSNPAAPATESRPSDQSEAAEAEIAPESAPASPAGTETVDPKTASTSTGGDGFVPMLADEFRDRSWVEHLTPGSMTIQLLGSYNESTAVNLVEQYPGVDLVYVRSTYKGRPWFVVLFGLYNDRAAARAGIGDLPESLREAGTWIRGTEGL